MLEIGTFYHFLKAYEATEIFVSQRHRPKFKGLRAMFKISLNNLVV